MVWWKPSTWGSGGSSATSTTDTSSTSTSSTSTSSTSSGGTYYPSSGTYVSPSGQGSSIATAPTGSTISLAPNPQLASSGGGGGGSSRSQLPMSTLDTPTPTAQVAKDIPSSYVTPEVTRTGIKSGFNYLKDKWKYDPKQAIKGAGQIAIGGIRETARERKEREFRESVERSKGQYVVSEEDKAAAMRGYSGTASGFSYQETSDQVLIRDAKLGDQSSLIAYTERVNEKNEIAFKTQENNQLNIDKNKLKNFTSNIQKQINAGSVSYEKGVEMQQIYANELDQERIIKIENKLGPRINQQQNKLDKIARTGRISRIAITAVGSIALGAVSAPLLLTAPKIVQTGAAVAGVGLMAPPTIKTTKGLVTGEAGLLDVAELVVPIAGFVAGGAIGMKIARVGNVRVDPKLNTALETAEVKVLSTKSLSSESQIRALKIPEFQKAELIMQLKAGESIGVRTWKLKAKTKSLQKVLDTQLPDTEIVSYGQTKALENVYTANTILKVKVGGKVNYVDLTSGQSVGVYSSKTGKLYVETITARAELGKPVTEIAKTRQVIKPKVKYFMEDGQLKRIVGAKSYSFEGMKIKAPKGKQITYEDLAKVVESEKTKKIPSAKSDMVEIQKAIKLQEKTALIDIGETGFELSARQVKFITEQSKVGLRKIPKPVEFERVPSKKMKPFEVTDSLKDLGKKTKPTKQSQKLIKQLDKQSSDLNILSQLDVPRASIESLKTAAKKTVEIPKQKEVLFSVEESKIELDAKQLNALSDTSFLDMDKLQKKAITKQVTITKQRKKSTQRPRQVQRIIQVPKIAQAPRQVSRIVQLPSQVPVMKPILDFSRLRKPRLEIPKFYLPSLKQKPIDFKFKALTMKKAKRRIPKYTASLAAAAFQAKPIKVSRKEYERLSKMTFTGAETRPVLQITEDEKKIKKQLEKVNF